MTPKHGKLSGTKCGKCNAKQIWKRSSKTKSGFTPVCDECRRAYSQDPRATASRRKYQTSRKARATRRKYSARPEVRKANRAARIKYEATPEGLEKVREANRRWSRSTKGRRYLEAYRESPECREAQERFSKGPGGKKQRTRRRARVREQLCSCCDGSDFWTPLRYIYPNARCYICGGPADAPDHIIPLSAGKLFPGGKHPMFPSGLACNRNMAPTCTSCNASKSNRVWPDLPGWEDFIHKRKLARRRELYWRTQR